MSWRQNRKETVLAVSHSVDAGDASQRVSAGEHTAARRRSGERRAWGVCGAVCGAVCGGVCGAFVICVGPGLRGDSRSKGVGDGHVDRALAGDDERRDQVRERGTWTAKGKRGRFDNSHHTTTQHTNTQTRTRAHAHSQDVRTRTTWPSSMQRVGLQR